VRAPLLATVLLSYRFSYVVVTVVGSGRAHDGVVTDIQLSDWFARVCLASGWHPTAAAFSKPVGREVSAALTGRLIDQNSL
jgi:hypothetical protein